MSTNPRSTNIWGKPLILTETKTNSKKVKLGGIIDYTGRNKTKQTNKTPKNLLDICPGRFKKDTVSIKHELDIMGKKDNLRIWNIFCKLIWKK